MYCNGDLNPKKYNDLLVDLYQLSADWVRRSNFRFFEAKFFVKSTKKRKAPNPTVLFLERTSFLASALMAQPTNSELIIPAQEFP